MKINVIGGGPAGLYFAIVMKKADPAHEVAVYERNGPDDTFGWGVVFSGKTLATLRGADERTHAEIIRDFEAWDNVDVVHRDEKVTVRGNRFSGIARIELLHILQRRCRELGIALNFRNDVAEVPKLAPDCDLLVGADGVNSTVRKIYGSLFEPSLSSRPNRYIWYGTNQLFHGLTLTFRENSAGVFAAHSYKFNRTTSTFIVECDERTWNNAGFGQMSDEDTRAYLAEVFAQDLHGHPLLSNNSKWINFVLVKNERWSNVRSRETGVGSHFPTGDPGLSTRDSRVQTGHVVLLGDALHTAHFSIGSGTKLAMEDAVALKQCFDDTSDVGAALQQFERARKPVIEEYQAAAYESMLWFENARQYMHLAPIELAYSLMTRSGRVDREELRKRDPQFVARYEAAM
jgi:anthraniloyl-CoA monooxygenase